MARIVAEYLEAKAVIIRIYGAEKKEMISFGFYPESANALEGEISFEDKVRDEGIQTPRCYVIPNLSKDENYWLQEKAERLGIRSLLVIPFLLPGYSLTRPETQGSLQISYQEEERDFSPLEIKMAEVLSKRVSNVIARRRIMDLEKMNVTKHKILEYIFPKLGRREGIKMEDMFNAIIPELAEIMRIQRCLFFPSWMTGNTSSWRLDIQRRSMELERSVP